MGLSCNDNEAAMRSGVAKSTGFPEFVEPIIINGKTFEKADIPETVNNVTALLCSAQSKPACQKISAAKFLLAAEETGVVKLKGSIKRYCTQLLA